MGLQEFKYGILQQGFQITEIGKYVKVSDSDDVGVFEIHCRVDLRDTDGLNWYREIVIAKELYGSNTHIGALQDAINEIYTRYSERQKTNVHTCTHENIVILGGLHLCINCKAKIKGKVPIDLRNKN